MTARWSLDREVQAHRNGEDHPQVQGFESDQRP
jgi:hypothetical protein